MLPSEKKMALLNANAPTTIEHVRRVVNGVHRVVERTLLFQPEWLDSSVTAPLTRLRADVLESFHSLEETFIDYFDGYDPSMVDRHREVVRIARERVMSVADECMALYDVLVDRGMTIQESNVDVPVRKIESGVEVIESPLHDQIFDVAGESLDVREMAQGAAHRLKNLLNRVV